MLGYSFFGKAIVVKIFDIHNKNKQAVRKPEISLNQRLTTKIRNFQTAYNCVFLLSLNHSYLLLDIFHISVPASHRIDLENSPQQKKNAQHNANDVEYFPCFNIVETVILLRAFVVLGNGFIC